jgi:hypothetical protein
VAAHCVVNILDNAWFRRHSSIFERHPRYTLQ